MNIGDNIARRWPKNWPLQAIPLVAWADQPPTYREASPAIIDAALGRAERRPTGNWYAFAGSRDIRTGRPFGTCVAGVELVAWRRGALVCRWHGLCLNGSTDEFGWRPLPSHDDGVLAWVRLDGVGGEEPLDQPVIVDRPTGDTLHAVTRLVGTCEPSDIIANRLDPWHGAWYHPYSFTRLEVLTTPTDEADRFLVAVTFRIGRVGVPTVAEFTSPEARTIVMRIVDGEGAGSVVETHATPIGLGPDGRPRTAVIEAVVAQSDRTGFRRARHAAPLIAGLMRVAASRLWKDDLAYAERRYQLRAG